MNIISLCQHNEKGKSKQMLFKEAGKKLMHGMVNALPLVLIICSTHFSAFQSHQIRVMLWNVC